MLTARENIVLPMSIAGRDPDDAWVDQLIDPSACATASRTARASSPAASSSASRSPARWPAGPPSSSPTSRRATSTRPPPTEILQLLRRSVDEFGQTIIMVTHDEEAAGYADRVLVLRDGQIVDDRAPTSPPSPRPGARPPWRKIAVRGLLARKLRLALTALAVALGVTLIAGTYIFTDTITKSFDTSSPRPTRAPTSRCRRNNDLAGDDDPPPIPASVLRPRQAGRRRRRGRGRGLQRGRLVPQGRRLQAQGHRASARSPARTTCKRFESFAPTEGHLPRTADEVAIPKGTADNEDFKVGDKLQIQDAAPKKLYTISGIVTIAGVDSFGGGVIAVMTLPEAQRMTGTGNAFDEIEVAAKPGVTPERAQGAPRHRSCPSGVEVRTGHRAGRPADQGHQDGLPGLPAHRAAGLRGDLAVRRRVPDLQHLLDHGRPAHPRVRAAAGARRQAPAGAALGAGRGADDRRRRLGRRPGARHPRGRGLKALFKAFGADLPSTGTVIATRTIVVSLLVGTVVTLISTLAPAIRATRVPPLAALREGLGQRAQALALGARRWPRVLTIGGLALMALGLFGTAKASAALSLMGLGAVRDVPRRGVAQPPPRRPDRRLRRHRRSSACAGSPGASPGRTPSASPAAPP